MEHRKQNPRTEIESSTIERRSTPSGLEIRSTEGSEVVTLRGYALRFGSIYDMGWFTEEVDASALQNANMDDVRILLNHDPNNILGRTSANTARVGVDNVGMWYEVDLPNSPNGANARVAVQRGDITQSSWGFSLRKDDTGRRTGDKWEMRNGKEHRILMDVDVVFDASPVVYPANPDTSIAKRNRDLAMRGESNEIREASSSWSIGWMVGEVASATYHGNEMISMLNSCMSNYEYYAARGTDEAPVFDALNQRCMEAKTAIVAFIDGHIDALKELNASENRSDKDTKPGDQLSTEIDTSELERFELRRMQLLN